MVPFDFTLWLMTGLLLLVAVAYFGWKCFIFFFPPVSTTKEEGTKCTVIVKQVRVVKVVAVTRNGSTQDTQTT